MSRNLLTSLCIAGLTFAPAAFAATPSPVAFVYVASDYTGTTSRIAGYSVAANGRLAAIPGSPFAANVFSMAGNGRYLLATDNINNSSRNIYSYLIGANGALAYKGATNIQTASKTDCTAPTYITLDHTGASAYVWGTNVGCSLQNTYQSYAVNKTTGLLYYLGDTPYNNNNLIPPLTFIPNNQFAYSAGSDQYVPEIDAYQRQLNGALVQIAVTTPLPSAPPNAPNTFVTLAAADASNHLAIDVAFNNVIPPAEQIATYTVNPVNGDLSTASTYRNMPSTAVGHALSLSMAPSGKILAVGGTEGLQLFNFPGTGQASALTGLLVKDAISNVTWDKSNHVFVTAGNRLYVFTVTPSGVRQAPGSPYAVTAPFGLWVQPR